MGESGELLAGGDEALLDHRKRLEHERSLGDEKQISARRHQLLMAAKEFAEPAFGAVALHGPADCGDRGDDADATQLRRIIAPGPPPKRKKATMDTVAVLPHLAEITLAAQVLLRA